MYNSASEVLISMRSWYLRYPMKTMNIKNFKLVKLLWKTVWKSLKKLKPELSYDLASPLLDI